MTYRSGHGGSKQHIAVIEHLAPDELPDPIPGEPAPLARREDGTIADSESAKALGARGGRAKADRRKLIDSLGLSGIAEGSAFAPYARAAEEFRDTHLVELAHMAGGAVGPAVATIVASAAIQLAASRYVMSQAVEANDLALMKTASSLANDSKQNLAMAYELAVRQAEARGDDMDPLTKRRLENARLGNG